MKNLWVEIRTAFATTVVLAVLVCGIYPAVIWGLGGVLSPQEAGGSLIRVQGRIAGSALIAQGFSGERYFHPRPSSAGTGYDAARSGGSNLGPLSRTLIETVGERARSYRNVNALPADAVVPVDAVTASGSGLDPHISKANALLQAARVAKARGLSGAEVRKRIERHTGGRDLGFLGEPRVNVLRLNLDLDGRVGQND